MNEPTLNYAQGGYRKPGLSKPRSGRGLVILCVLGSILFLGDCLLFGATIHSYGWGRVGIMFADAAAIVINLTLVIFSVAYWQSHEFTSGERWCLGTCTLVGPAISALNLVLCFTLPSVGGC